MIRLRALFLFTAVFLAVFAAAAGGGEVPSPPETSVDPSRHGGQRPPPSARVTVAIPASGGQATVRTIPSVPAAYQETRSGQTSASPSSVPSSGMSYRAYTGEAFTSEPYSGMAAAAEAADPASPSGEAAPKPRALAILDGKEITDQDVARELWARRGRETFDWMVGKAVLDRELTRLGLTVSDAEVEARLSEHMADLARVFPTLANRDDLARAASGMGLDEYRERTVWVELALRKVMRETLKPSDDQLRVYFAERRAAFVEPDRVRISQIFVAPAAGPDGDVVAGPGERAEAERLILEAHSRLRAGEDFRDVASSYASGAAAARWVERGELMRELEDAAFSLRPGAVSAPIRTAMGYHIIKVEERRERTVPRFEDVRDKVLAEYENKFFLAAAGDFLVRLKEKAAREGWLVVAEDQAFAESGR